MATLIVIQSEAKNPHGHNLGGRKQKFFPTVIQSEAKNPPNKGENIAVIQSEAKNPPNKGENIAVILNEESNPHGHNLGGRKQKFFPTVIQSEAKNLPKQKTPRRDAARNNLKN